MIHYTLNTGHSRESPHEEVGDDVIRTLQPLLRAGNHDLPVEGYRAVITLNGGGVLCSIYHDQRPCITLGVATDADSAASLWPALEQLYYRITEMPGVRAADFAVAKQPDRVPWCAAMTVLATPDEAVWMADFERCLAWACIEKNKGKHGRKNNP